MSDTRSFLFVMDPIETLNLETETSLLLMTELLVRGHTVLWTEACDLMLRQNKLYAASRKVSSVTPLHFEATVERSIDEVDALLVRPDPPFGSLYLHLTYLLDFVSDTVVQFNPGAALRNFNEKLTTLRFSRHAPRTLTTMNRDALLAFLQDHGEIVIKPLDECSGRGIDRLSSGNPDATTQIETLLKAPDGTPRFVTAQEFLTDVANGDKRVYLAGGEPVGIVNRIPREGGWLGNIHQGARCERAELSAQEHAIIEELKPFLLENGIFLAGLDFIGEKITEINITSPSAVRQINEVTGGRVHETIVTLMLERLATSANLC